MSLNLVFGATGYLGNAIKKGLETEKNISLGVSRKDTQGRLLKLEVKSDLNNWKILRNGFKAKVKKYGCK